MKATLALLAALGALIFAGCGDDEDSSEQGGSEEEARQLVADGIDAYDRRDFEALCELSSQEINESIPQLAETKDCPSGYEELFRRQNRLEGEGRPFDEYVEMLTETEIGEATLTDDGATVDLDSPKGPAKSFLIVEDGELKIQELFLSENNPAAQAGPSQVVPSTGE
jgi:hypothetical protein